MRRTTFALSLVTALGLTLVACQPPKKHDEDGAVANRAATSDVSATESAVSGEHGEHEAEAAVEPKEEDVRIGPDGKRVEWPALAADSAPEASPRKGQAEWAAKLASSIEGQWASKQGRRLTMQVDKPLYNPGETVWVRLWDVRTADLGAADKAEGVTFELVSPSGSLKKSVDVKTEKGRASHGFDIAKSDVGGEYVVRATTHDGQKAERPVFVNAFVVPRVQKELDFVRKAYGPGDEVQADLQLRSKDGAPLAAKTVSVVARVDGEELPATKATTGVDGRATVAVTLPGLIEVGDGVLTVMVEDGGVTESVSKRIPIIVKKVTFELFPEGGDLVLGLPSRVYFEAKRPIGKPADVEGRVVDDKGELVAEFVSYRDGRGRFAITPQPGRSYRAEITKPEGVAETFLLPDAKTAGCVLQSFDDLDGELDALRVAVQCTEAREVAVVATMRENMLDSATLDVALGAPAVAYLKPADTALAKAQGVARVTVFGADRAPLAERVVYRNRRHRLRVAIAPDKATYAPREQVKLIITTSAPSGEPVAADVALSVVDDAVVSFADDKEGHILSALLLEPDIDGELEDPNFYFDLTERRSPLAMDLLMGTRGWRRFDWKPVLDPAPAAQLASADASEAESEAARQQAPASQARPMEVPMPGGAAPAPLAKAGGLEGGELEGAKMQALLGSGLEAQGFDAVGAWGAFDGDMGGLLGEAQGGGGLGLAGAGQGGGGAAVGGFGIGGFGTAGRGKGIGFGGGRIGGKAARRPKLKPGRPDVTGSLDKRIIRKVVNMHRNEMRFCYEQELLLQPDLDGKIIVKWVLDAAGNVSSAVVQDTTMNNKKVEACLTSRIRKWRFPAPKGGGVVVVSYPFVFEAGDGPSHGGGYVMPSRNWVAVRQFPLPDYASEQNPAVRTDFRQTVFWSPSVSTDATGKATVSFYLSDAVTTFRVFGEAVGGGAIGREEQTFASQLPFSMVAKIPAEVSASDRIDMPVTLSNDRDAPATVNLAGNFGELLLPQGDGIPSSVQVAAGSAETLYFPLLVGDGHTTTKARFSASTEMLSDAFERDVTIVPLGYPEAIGQAGMLKASATLTADLTHAVPGSLKARLALEPSPTATMLQGMEGMLREPSGCFEQTSSSNYPNTMVLSFVQGHQAHMPDLESRARGLLSRGYERLVGYEVQGGGYEWFGRAPAHPALTAYGVLEFTDMKQVTSIVDQAMLDRSTRWLMGLQDGNGGFKPPAGQTLHTWSAQPAYANAYITYALTEAGRGADIAAAVQAQAEAVKTVDDPYLLALGTLALFNVPEQVDAARAAAKRLASMQGEDGGWTTAKISVVESRGLNLHIETTALAMMALMDAGGFDGAVVKGVAFLMDNRQGYGRYGATQATVLALQALTRYSNTKGKGEQGGSVSILVDGREVARQDYGANQGQALVFEGLEEYLIPGKTAAVEIKHTGDRELPYTLTLDYRTTLPNNSPNAPVHVETKLDKSSVQMGENVQLLATIRNVSGAPVPMTVARIGFPGGLTTQKWQLEELVDAKTAAFVETRAREAIVYLDGLEVDQVVQIPLELNATIPGKYTGPATSTYLYYGDTDKHWAAPLEVEIGH